MTRSGVHGLVKRLAKRACVKKASLANKTIGPHVIRHYLPFLTISGIERNSSINIGFYRVYPEYLHPITRHSFSG